ncbi:hypothetical protein GCM10028781_07930 [Nostocoides australiense]
MALHSATSAAVPSAGSSHEPAARAAGGNAAKIPAPIIADSPTITASPVPRRRARAPCTGLLMVGRLGDSDDAVVNPQSLR